jgi:crotonobetainyl-CoA:carnitine CoA-transferase CaiB-like acyl-CoA transferase
MESIWEFDHPFAGPMRQARPPARFSETPSEIFHCSPELGQHTREILSEFGLSKERARELIDKKIAQ